MPLSGDRKADVCPEENFALGYFFFCQQVHKIVSLLSSRCYPRACYCKSRLKFSIVQTDDTCSDNKASCHRIKGLLSERLGGEGSQVNFLFLATPWTGLCSFLGQFLRKIKKG